MDIAVVGGGPAGLFFARRVKLLQPGWRVRLFEQNAHDATYGFGVGLLGQSLEFIGRTDPPVLEDIVAAAHAGSGMGFVHNGETVLVNAGSGSEAVTIGRITLLNILQRRCEEVGVELYFESRVEDIESLRQAVDVLVGADGVNSPVRTCYRGKVRIHRRAAAEPVRLVRHRAPVRPGADDLRAGGVRAGDRAHPPVSRRPFGRRHRV